MQATCPDIQEFRKLLLGQLELVEISSLQLHLVHCPECLATISDLGTDDPLIRALQSQSGFTEKEGDVVEKLIERLREQGGPAFCNSSVSTPGCTLTDTQASTDSTREIDPEDYGFLHSSSKAGELGRLGPYGILGVLGSGGMGIVFEAEDPQLERRVALKVMKPELATRSEGRQRFLLEARTMAAIQHDNIVTIHQVGEDRGIPFLAMQLLQGETLESRLARDQKLPMTDVLRIGSEIAEGLSVAHARGLFHRDIKPANIWLEKTGGLTSNGSIAESSTTPDQDIEPSGFRVKILDFGLARAAVDATHLTQSGVVAGTPAYMAPEQASDGPVDHRCDLFSLGCVLYRMATGQLPFQGTKTLTILWALAVKHPTAPKQLNPEIPTALSDLIMRLLAKVPGERTQTAREVVRTLRSIERGTAQVDRPMAPPKRRGFVFAAVACSLFAIGAFCFGPEIYRLSTNQGQLIIESDDPDVSVIVKQDDQTVTIVDAKSGKTITLKAGAYRLELSEGNQGLTLATDHFTLERGGKTIVKVRMGPPVITEVRRFTGLSELPYSASFCLDGHCVLSCGGGEIQNGQWLPGKDFALRIWDETGKEIRRLEGHRGVVSCLAVSPDGQRALSGGGSDEQDFAIRLWDLKTGTLVRTLEGSTGRVMSLVFTPDGRFAISAGGRPLDSGSCPIRYWDLETGKELGQFYGHTEEVRSLSLSADGQILLSGSQDGTARIWDVTARKELRRLALEDSVHLTVSLSPDGRMALTAGQDPVLRVWDTSTGKLIRSLRGHTSTWIGGVAILSDGRRALSGGGDENTIRLWDLETGKEIAQFEGDMYTPNINNRPCSPDGRFALSVGWDKTIRLLQLPPPYRDISGVPK